MTNVAAASLLASKGGSPTEETAMIRANKTTPAASPITPVALASATHL